ncbi:MAG: tetratricopeptide repeat protein [Leptospirillia bacterium]
MRPAPCLAGLTLILSAACSSPVESRLDAASLEMQQGAYERAISIYEDLLVKVPDAPNLHNNMGYALLQLGRYEEALSHFEAALEGTSANTQRAALLHNWANALEKLGDLEASADMYSSAADADPFRAETHVNWGNVLVRLGKLEEAVEHYRKGTDINPDNATGWFNLGNSYERLGRLNDALESYRQFLSTGGDSPSNMTEHARRFVAQAEAAAAGEGTDL